MRLKYPFLAAATLTLIYTTSIHRQSATRSVNSATSKTSTSIGRVISQPINLLEDGSPHPVDAMNDLCLIAKPSGTTDAVPPCSTTNVARGNSTYTPSSFTPTQPTEKNSNLPASDDFAPQVEAPSAPAPASLPRGIRLAESVKLPAVILAISAAENDPHTKLSAPVAAALHRIVDTFYQNLADSVEQVEVIEVPAQIAAETADVVEDTIIIQPGAAVELAREQANETYRALFGDAAYDQMTMRALMESHLPAVPLTSAN